MKKRPILGAVCAVLIIFMVIFGSAIVGMVARISPWEEDSFAGKPIAGLRGNLQAKGRSLSPVDAGSFYALTGYTLKNGELGLEFQKGGSYNWWPLGTAVNLGRVVVANDANKTIIRIYHGRSVDSL